MFRKDLIKLLLDAPSTVADIARLLDASPKDVEADIKHLLKSLKRSGLRAVVTPAECRKCGFVFGKDKLRKPGKCPMCYATWIREPQLYIESKPSH